MIAVFRFNDVAGKLPETIKIIAECKRPLRRKGI